MPPTRRQSNRTVAARKKSIYQRRKASLNDAIEGRCNFHMSPFSLDDKAICLGEAFDKAMIAIRSLECKNCLRNFPTVRLQMGICTTCLRSKNKNKYTSSNNMDPGDVPPELQDLTYIEQMMIAQCHPVISFYKIRGAQHAYSGNVITFYQNVNEYITKLPIHPGKLPATIVFNKDTPAGYASFRVRGPVLYRALLWLKKNNLYYNNISIDEVLIQNLPEDGDASSILTTMSIESQDSGNDSETIVDSYVPLINNVDQDKIIAQELHLDYPSLSGTPINEFETEGYIALAFPALFPRGNADYLRSRDTKVTRDEYFKYLIEYHDGRFARDPRFRFFALNTLMRHRAIQDCNLYARKSKIDKMDIETLKKLINDDQSLLNHIMVYTSNLRSTKPYWNQRCSELLSMVEQLGKPTIFFTLSAADYHWKSLFQLLTPDSDLSEISEKRRAQLMHDNPILAGYHYQERARLFITKVVIPYFNVTDHWYRHEWQSRGSSHTHGVLWLKNSPNIPDLEPTDEEIQNAKDYFDKMCFAYNLDVRTRAPDNTTENSSNYPESWKNPCRKNFSDIPDDAKELDLYDILNAVQRHTRHSNHCLRQKSKNSPMTCRFNFPMDCSETSSLNNENGYYTYLPARNDPLMQRYNHVLSIIWRANTDFSPIISKQAVLMYIAKYAAKAEVSSKSYIKLIGDIMSKMGNDSPAKTALMKLILASVSERDYSAQEVAHLLMGWPLYSSSRNFLTLMIKDDDWKKLQVRMNIHLLVHYDWIDTDYDYYNYTLSFIHTE